MGEGQGFDMLETLNIINSLSNKGMNVIFILQPKLSTIGQHNKLLLAIYGYFAEAERECISIRTKQGLVAAKVFGKQLWRPKGSENKNVSALTRFNVQIREYLKLGLTTSAIQKIINNQLTKPLSYNTFRYYTEMLINNK